jgi:3-hydroxyisobutyrate dehydrogenase
MKVGFIGLGIMGDPMSANLARKLEIEVLVYDTDPKTGFMALAAGAKHSESARALAGAVDVIFTMLPNGSIVFNIYDSIKDLIHNGQIWVDMSTISPKESREIAYLVRKKDGSFLDAPVVRSRAAAVDGKLGIYVGGPKESYLKIRAFLECMGSNIVHLGENGSGLVMKLCHNMLVGQIQNGVNESLALARRVCGISPTGFAQAISYGGGQNFYLDSKAAIIEEGDFTASFSAANMNKDINLASELAVEAGLTLDGLELVRRRYREIMDRNLGSMDFSVSWQLFS